MKSEGINKLRFKEGFIILSRWYNHHHW